MLSRAGEAKAAAFQNLNFESLQFPLVPDPIDPYGEVPPANALPGWIAYVGTEVESLSEPQSSFINTASVSLWGPGMPFLWPPAAEISPNLIAGNYTAFVQCGSPGLHPGSVISTSVSLAQTELVPARTYSLFLSIDAHFPLSVFLGVQTLALLPVRQAAKFTVYGADITAFADQTAELKIATAAEEIGYLRLDSIGFSPVPEPSLIDLGGVGVLVLGFRLRRNLSKRQLGSGRLGHKRRRDGGARHEGGAVGPLDLLVNLLAMHGDFGRGLDADLHEAAFGAHNLDDDTAVDDDVLVDLAGKDKHGGKGLTATMGLFRRRRRDWIAAGAAG
jgi:hypothetical protein